MDPGHNAGQRRAQAVRDVLHLGRPSRSGPNARSARTFGAVGWLSPARDSRRTVAKLWRGRVKRWRWELRRAVARVRFGGWITERCELCGSVTDRWRRLPGHGRASEVWLSQEWAASCPTCSPGPTDGRTA
jgi:hypothetical protein